MAESGGVHPRRRFNDDRRRVFGGSGRLIAFVCECPSPDCRESVLLTVEQYETAARDGLVLHQSHAVGVGPGFSRPVEPPLGRQAPH